MHEQAYWKYFMGPRGRSSSRLLKYYWTWNDFTSAYFGDCVWLISQVWLKSNWELDGPISGITNGKPVVWQFATCASIDFIIMWSGCRGPHETTRLLRQGDYRWLRGVNQTTKISQSYSSKRSNQSICNCPSWFLAQTSWTIFRDRSTLRNPYSCLL